jgi:hypothetical protein
MAGLRRLVEPRPEEERRPEERRQPCVPKAWWAPTQRTTVVHPKPWPQRAPKPPAQRQGPQRVRHTELFQAWNRPRRCHRGAYQPQNPRPWASNREA